MVDVLIVEDDPMVVEVNTGFVSAVAGFSVVGAAGTGKEAVLMVQKYRPQLVLLDIYLPDMDGVATLEEMRRRQLPTDVIMVTAARDAETVRKVFRFGAVDYIIKPFKFDRLQSALQYYAAMHSCLKSKDDISQQELDELAWSRFVHDDTKENIPKGLSEVTLKQVLLFLIKSNRAVSAYEVSEKLGMARVTARRYLEYLENMGKVSLEVQYGGVGRPINRYRVI
ncbi:MAG: response regulator [Firmicutes bacterium]|nr:response regulator [Bacillota bacterium]